MVDLTNSPSHDDDQLPKAKAKRLEQKTLMSVAKVGRGVQVVPVATTTVAPSLCVDESGAKKKRKRGEERTTEKSIRVAATEHDGGLVVAFTGARDGMSPGQKKVVEDVLVHGKWPSHPARLSGSSSTLSPIPTRGTFLHGCCIGADEEAHALASSTTAGNEGPTQWSIQMFPSNIKDATSTKCPEKLPSIKLAAPPKPPLQRNKTMVDRSSIVLAAPPTDKELLRSGTWSTIRYAVKKNKMLILVSPCGDIRHAI